MVNRGEPHSFCAICRYTSNDCALQVGGIFTDVICDLNSYFDGLVQDCSITSGLAMELRQSCAKPSICEVDMTSAWLQLQIYIQSFIEVVADLSTYVDKIQVHKKIKWANI